MGEANGLHSLFSQGSGQVVPVDAGTTSSTDALAVETGGGLDVRLSRHLAIRAIQVSYLRTQLPNSTTNVQNSFSIGAGLVMRFGKKAVAHERLPSEVPSCKITSKIGFPLPLRLSDISWRSTHGSKRATAR
jgi:hypothetical protein